jgi:hypothetical protein
MFPSSFLANSGHWYIFGGVTGPYGSDPILGDVFFTIDTSTGNTTVLPCAEDANCPALSAVNPVTFMDNDETTFYVYSGMRSDSSHFDNQLLYSYDVRGKRWNTPTAVPRAANCVFNGLSVNAYVTRLLIIGGDGGPTIGSVSNAWNWDLTTDPPAFEPLAASLPQRCESPVVGIDETGMAFIYSGAVYDSSSSFTALAYVRGVVRLGPPTIKGPSFVVPLIFIIILLCCACCVGGALYVVVKYDGKKKKGVCGFVLGYVEKKIGGGGKKKKKKMQPLLG